ncbi:uncharacterized protein N7446_013414 [Penicillium canescens]|uniref:uncharacterized protein n=1 Tax=Penicillium canescens TaxID=5083 RepID=UPI0026E10704|nr:uncharacterized protein N7446_013414 [Penicillium canescens]KAJ6042348.1 hypothetical protein N7446_013414 [Penicillium canescens]
MAEAERPLEEDWERQQSKAWSLPPYDIGAISSPDEDNQPSHALNIPSGFSKDPTSTPQPAVPHTCLSSGQNTQIPSISASSPSGPSQQARGAGSSQQKISNPAPVVPLRNSPRPYRSWGGKRSTRHSTNTSGPPIQAQVSPLAGGGARSHQPVRTQRSSPSVTQPQACRTQRSTVSQAFCRLETNVSTQGVQGSVDSAAKDSFGKAKWRAGATPDGYLRLPHTIDRFQEIITQLTKKTAQPVTNFRDFIAKATGAYLTVRYQGVPVVLIWGDRNQVLAAHTLLLTFVTQVNQLQETSKVPGWTRINAHSTVKVDIANTKDARTSQLDGLRKAPITVADSTVSSVWPPNGPSQEHCLSSRRQLLDSIRLHYGMNIYTKPGARENLYFSGGNHGDLLGMVSRSRDLWKTLSLQCETEIKVLLVEPPPLKS